MQQRGSGLVAFILVIVALGVFGYMVWQNAQPTPALRVIVPTEVEPTDDPNAWQSILRSGFGENSTPLPTVAIPTLPYAPPTLSLDGTAELAPLAPEEVRGEVDLTATPANIGATPTRPAPSLTPLATSDVEVTAQYVTQLPSQWQPPPLEPPLSRDPLGRDHYWFIRPVDSDGANFPISYYPFGSDGSADNPLRVHHGIDMSNPIGKTVRAAGSGTVLWAADGLRTEGGVFENSPSYGNVVVIQHDFGYRGEALYTIYAHLSAVLVTRDQYVNSGDAIGLVGNTGRVTGPHVHFEVRLGENRYANTYNPTLWMVPYVGHGVIAGRVLDVNGDMAQDVTVTVRNWGTGLVADTTTTYLFQDTGFDVNVDPNWQENFAVADVPVGRYEVIANVDGTRLSKVITVVEGATNFVELALPNPATIQAMTDTP